MIVKEIGNDEINIALDIYNECFNRNTKKIDISLIGDLLGLYVDDNLVGIIQIDYVNNIMENERIAIINNFCIKKEYRNKGYGNYLLNEAINYLKDKGINKINLTSNKNRVYAHMLYKKNNFLEVDTIMLNKELEK